mmetsp:Transcript_68439/g.198463  ORF Transcript_68439/g.198463 Transcript_68439/m.198463 type:complete len:296 (-) Transcript_68439:129-1016(-)|eukprot:CAMPEP_0176049674 /NCGR_PEP_ID=MMETSP0120_2-20121206/24684_1 /TAXON_ID=160619 /ORGANISM="Kryptoperidinium foliaceum, Strain CCMP 1326" /LENGTH=295 /DNA_ID=CAMNT_0017383101 /DNA_START=66 /DNA_END=953 /DNA_ORIENTATION=+
MKIASVALVVATAQTANAFLPVQPRSAAPTVMKGYLEDLGAIGPEEEVEEDDSREATQLSKDQVANYGVGSWDSYVEFNEFDGGDGQMGVAGDGNAKLEKFDMSQMAKSKTMSAKNAWGTNTGYADSLRAQGVETSRAQQLENWHNQQEVRERRKQQQFMTDQFDQVNEDENWRNLASFGIERNQDFDMEEAFGDVQIGEIEGTIEMTARMNGPASVYEFGLRNPYMGFADFRAAFTPDSSPDFTVTPGEGSLKQKEDTGFMIRFKPQRPGGSEGYLVIETEDFKKTWKVIGTTA